ncbi:hypothetical protein CP500_013195 [Tychonema bourrellyi FEM_GT703]|uniref:Uncharacterized protein n=1 Tax=Tychonema bourrellyi FEM_GT703 TaxID=2040638 RepID=A0A2G4EZN8_9CYAN|nr:hypothetical protein CP500_013195 [Tychonema bourrellyi FEM_GT703]
MISAISRVFAAPRPSSSNKSKPMPPVRISLPFPPSRISFPAPPLSVSKPLPPSSLSLPLLPVRISLPLLPFKAILLPRIPVKLSSLSVPLISFS